MAFEEQAVRPGQAGEANIADLTADIVSAYVSHNNVPPAQLPEIIGSVSAALRQGASASAQPEPEPQKPAVPIRSSVKPEEITCLECGKRFKSIKRHLSNAHGLQPAEYRVKWGLRRDYPMTAPAYAEKRSALAKAIGLGQKRQAPKAGAKARGKRAAKPKAEAAAT